MTAVVAVGNESRFVVEIHRDGEVVVAGIDGGVVAVGKAPYGLVRLEQLHEALPEGRPFGIVNFVVPLEQHAMADHGRSFDRGRIAPRG